MKAKILYVVLFTILVCDPYDFSNPPFLVNSYLAPYIFVFQLILTSVTHIDIDIDNLFPV
jgi:hypothetical protein